MLSLCLILVAAPNEALAAKLAEIGAKHGVPGIAALATYGDKRRAATWGVRKDGDSTPIGPGDRWHLGSDTKAMTATVAAILVEQGKLAWTTPVSTALADWTDLDPAYATITLEMLLNHRGGMRPDVDSDLWEKMWKPKAPDGQRQPVVHALLTRKVQGTVGEYVYSNVGYMVAGVMLEKVTGKTWEELMRELLFAPLGMDSCGFGPPASPRKVDAPWSHRVKDGKLEALGPAMRGADNPAGLGPAGTAHCSLPDWHTFVAAHVAGDRGEPTALPLSQTAFAKLHGAGAYSFGWGVSANPDTPTARTLSHDGSNTMFYCSVVAIPNERVIVLVATNRGDPEGQAAVGEAVTYLLQR